MSSKSPLDSRNSTEVKIIKRGKFYLTPFQLHHIEEVVEHLSEENRHELKLLGYDDLHKAVASMYAAAECYIAREEGKPFTMVGGLWHHDDSPDPQMFAMFSDNIRKSFHTMARGSRMLVSLFDKNHDTMTMTILAKYQFAVDWACWLGFEPVEMFTQDGNEYVNFVRCTPPEGHGYNISSRPVMH